MVARNYQYQLRVYECILAFLESHSSLRPLVSKDSLDSKDSTQVFDSKINPLDTLSSRELQGQRECLICCGEDDALVRFVPCGHSSCALCLEHHAVVSGAPLCFFCKQPVLSTTAL